MGTPMDGASDSHFTFHCLRFITLKMDDKKPDMASISLKLKDQAGVETVCLSARSHKTIFHAP
jgi:hypothetical protein